MKYYCILLVDDEPHIINMLLKLLDGIEDMDLDVYYAYNAMDALNYIQKGHIDLLVTDIKMPGITGLELLEAVNRRGQGTKAILLTAYPDFEYAYEAFQQKAISYLLKTEEPEVIKNTVIRALEQVEQDRRLAKYEEPEKGRLPGDEACDGAAPESEGGARQTLAGNEEILHGEVSGEDLREESSQDRTHMLVNSLKDYIDSHAADDVSLMRLSELTGYNSSYISWLFHNETGMKLNQYISQKKMEMIDRYLRTSLSIDEIIAKTGFHSRRYFNIFVKRETGMAPGEYRKRLQEEKGQRRSTGE